MAHCLDIGCVSQGITPVIVPVAVTRTRPNFRPAASGPQAYCGSFRRSGTCDSTFRTSAPRALRSHRLRTDSRSPSSERRPAPRARRHLHRAQRLRALERGAL